MDEMIEGEVIIYDARQQVPEPSRQNRVPNDDVRDARHSKHNFTRIEKKNGEFSVQPRNEPTDLSWVVSEN